MSGLQDLKQIVEVLGGRVSVGPAPRSRHREAGGFSILGEYHGGVRRAQMVVAVEELEDIDGVAERMIEPMVLLAAIATDAEEIEDSPQASTCVSCGCGVIWDGAVKTNPLVLCPDCHQAADRDIPIYMEVRLMAMAAECLMPPDQQPSPSQMADAICELIVAIKPEWRPGEDGPEDKE
jgi:hypothetical protein